MEGGLEKGRNSGWDDGLVLRVRNAHLKYGDNRVLRGLNMTLSQGNMYTMIGSSGCGKTTLLNCILGVLKLDAGRVDRKWNFKSDIGHMPQELALSTLLTIRELFNYFRRVYSIDEAVFREKHAKLNRILSLPPDNRIIENLSGGEQRRVSLAVAVLHDPKILILDEPTVGQDPLLRQSIWDFLVRITREENKTVILSTHYVEEAKQADMVGMLREGVLMCEESPDTIMVKCNSDNLQDAFLVLSAGQQENAEDVQPTANAQPEEVAPSDGDGRLEGRCPYCGISPGRFLAELTKNFRILCRSKLMVLFQILVPTLLLFSWNMVIGTDPVGIKVGIVNDELEDYNVTCGVPQDPIQCNDEWPLSCHYTGTLLSKFETVQFATTEDGIGAMKRGGVWAVMNFPKNYTQSLLVFIEQNYLTDNVTLDDATISVWYDNAEYVTKNFLLDNLTKIFKTFMEELFEACGFRKTTYLPISIQKPVYGYEDAAMTLTKVSPFIVQLIFYFAMTYTAPVIFEKRSSRFLKRASLAGVTTAEMFISELLLQGFLLFVQVCQTWVITFFVFEVPVIGSHSIMFVLALLTGTTGALVGCLIACSTSSSSIVTLTPLVVTSLLFFLSGALWPQEAFPSYIKSIMQMLPTFYTIESINSIMLKSMQVSYLMLWKGFLSTFVWIIILSLIIYVCIRRNKSFMM